MNRQPSMRRTWLKSIGACVLSVLMIPVIGGLVVGGVLIWDELTGSEAKIAITGAMSRVYEDSRPSVRCYDSAGGESQGIIYISEGFGVMDGDGFINIYLPVNPAIGTYQFYESGPSVDLFPGNPAYTDDFGVVGWLFDDNGSLDIYPNLRTGTITLDSLQSGWHKRLRGSFELTLAGEDDPVFVNGTFDIPTRNQDVHCLE